MNWILEPVLWTCGLVYAVVALVVFLYGVGYVGGKKGIFVGIVVSLFVGIFWFPLMFIHAGYTTYLESDE